ncbi:MAG: beta-galactosidase [Bacteroidaceae bacterium]|nr:beta-galactosidase [Bacteroidaceae bacterium]
MKRSFTLMTMGMAFCASALAQWSPAGDKIKTKWADEINLQSVWQEYPRPIMERTEWKNLNGLWNYAILDKGAQTPTSFDGQILVPFAVESALSGVGKTVTPNQELWYQRTFDIPKTWAGKRILLHFGAVDWKTDVWVNGMNVGGHVGGYQPFSFDITDALKAGNNELTLRVWDPTDKGYQPHGKQVAEPNSIWYTAVTGIWQTVWLEPVNEVHIAALKTTPDIDARQLSIEVLTDEASTRGLQVEATVFDGNRQVAKSGAINGQPIMVQMPADMKLWTPDTPNLYTVKVRLLKNGREVDAVNSYAAMRKISVNKDEHGIWRMQLNNKDQFQMGPLDQGWWPDGLYTAPCDEALAYDLQKTKDLGFNMIRKHVKVEMDRWYYHCDRLGILVWQDMPSGDSSPRWQNHNYFTGVEFQRSTESEANYRREWKEIIDALYSHPCIVVWVPFNEAWGQFKTQEITEWTKQYDPSRLVNPASGGNFYTTGDILDLHNYPAPDMYLYDGSRVNVLGEYGGIGLALEGHLWFADRNWGYVQFKSSEEVTAEYLKYADQLLELVKRGFSAAVYTQTTDCEGEVNGLLTYDRKVVKMNEAQVRAKNQELCRSLSK